MSTKNKPNNYNLPIDAYKKAKKIGQSPQNTKKWELTKSSADESIDIMKLFLPWLLSIMGIVLAVPSISQHYVMVFCIAIFIIIIAGLGCFFYSYWHFCKNIYKKKSGKLSIEIRIEDYIVNMMKLLSEYKYRQNTRLLFAVGMNGTALEKIKENASSITKDDLISVCHDFFWFAELVGIDVFGKIHESLRQMTEVPRKGDLFTVDFEITNASGDFDVLNGSRFTVAFYVNSLSADGHFGVGHEDIENGQETVIHLIGNLSDYIYANGKGNKREFVLLLPAIGTGKSGKSPYRNVLLEIINCLSISGYCIPHKVIISLRSIELFDNNYEASSLLRLSTQILRHGRS